MPRNAKVTLQDDRHKVLIACFAAAGCKARNQHTTLIEDDLV